jgi:hypothetical protein
VVHVANNAHSGQLHAEVKKSEYLGQMKTQL